MPEETIQINQLPVADELTGAEDVPMFQAGRTVKAPSSGVVPDATAAVKGKLRLAGDLAGTADAPTVPGLGTHAADTTAVHGITDTTVLATDAEVAAAVTAHEAAANPHAVYETSAEAQAKVDAHAAAGDPHPGYLTAAEGNAAYEPTGAVATHSADTTAVHGITDTAALATDAEVAAAFTAHTAGADPHAGYRLESVPIAAADVAADVATQAELDAHVNDTTAAHAATAIGFAPAGTIAATTVQAAIEEVAAEAGTGGAPTTADYLVGTAQAGLSAEIVVGATPGGELGGTWASPTVDATHSGSAHLALGTTGTTAAAGNDARLSDQRTPLDDSVTSAKIAAGAIVDADVNAAAAIAESKLNLASDAAAGTASRRTLGTGATQAAAGNDARLSDTRTPTDGSVTTAKIANNAVTAAKVAADVATQAELDAHAATPHGGASGSTKIALFSHPGPASPGAGLGLWPLPPDPVTITAVRAIIGTSPLATPLIYDLNHNDVSLYTTQANRPSIAPGTRQIEAALPNTTVLPGGGYLSADIDQVGTTPIPSVVEAEAWNSGTAASTSFTVPMPLTVLAGQLCIVYLAVIDNPVTITWPAGWTQKNRYNTVLGALTLAVAWKVAAVDGEAGGTGTLSVSKGSAAVTLALAGTQTDAPWDVEVDNATDSNTLTPSTAQAITTPVISSITVGTGGSHTAGTKWLRVSAYNGAGETLASVAMSATVTAGATLSPNWTAIPGAAGYGIYRGNSSGTEQFVAKVGQVTTYLDTGAITPAGALPAANTTLTPTSTDAGELAIVAIASRVASGGTNSVTPPTGFTEPADGETLTTIAAQANALIEVSAQVLGAAGALGPFSATHAVSTKGHAHLSTIKRGDVQPGSWPVLQVEYV